MGLTLFSPVTPVIEQLLRWTYFFVLLCTVGKAVVANRTRYGLAALSEVPVPRPSISRFSCLNRICFLIGGWRFHGQTKKMCGVYDLWSLRFSCSVDGYIFRMATDWGCTCCQFVIGLVLVVCVTPEAGPFLWRVRRAVWNSSSRRTHSKRSW